MKRWARWFAAVAFVSVAAATMTVVGAGAAANAPAKPAGRYACVVTANDAELKVDLGAGEGGVWQSEITVTVMGGTAEITGTVYDVERMTAKKKKPPQLKLKPKILTAAQKAE